MYLINFVLIIFIRLFNYYIYYFLLNIFLMIILEIPCLISKNQEEILIAKFNEYSQSVINNNQLLSFNTNLYYILKNTKIYKDNINKMDQNKSIFSIPFQPSSKENFIQYYQQYFHNKSKMDTESESVSTKHTQYLSKISSNISHNNTQEEDSWVELTSKSNYSLVKTQSPELSEEYEHHVRSSSSLESFTTQEEEINENNTSFYSRTEIIPSSMDSYPSNIKSEKSTSIATTNQKSMDNNINNSQSINDNDMSSSLMTNITTISNSTTTPNLPRFIPIEVNQKSDRYSKGYLAVIIIIFIIIIILNRKIYIYII